MTLRDLAEYHLETRSGWVSIAGTQRPQRLYAAARNVCKLCVQALKITDRVSHRTTGAKEGVKDPMFNEAPQLGTHGTVNV